MRVLQDEVEDVLGRDGAQHLGVALDQVVHVEPGDFELDLLRIILVAFPYTLHHGLSSLGLGEGARASTWVLAGETSGGRS